MVKNNDLIYGIHPLMEALQGGMPMNKVFMKNGLRGEHVYALKGLIHKWNIPLQHVPMEKLNRLTNKNHQGVVGLTSPVPFHSLGDLIPGIFEKGQTPLIVVLDQITDMRNLGAVCRTAEAAGAHAVVIPEKGSAAITADTMKASAGALSYIPICRENNLKNTVMYLKDSGIQVVAAAGDAQMAYTSLNIGGPVAIIMGSEGKGISSQLLQMADHAVKIPMLGEISSLNVSVAAGILLFEMVRNRSLNPA